MTVFTSSRAPPREAVPFTGASMSAGVLLGEVRNVDRASQTRSHLGSRSLGSNGGSGGRSGLAGGRRPGLHGRVGPAVARLEPQWVRRTATENVWTGRHEARWRRARYCRLSNTKSRVDGGGRAAVRLELEWGGNKASSTTALESGRQRRKRRRESDTIEAARKIKREISHYRTH